MGYDFYIFFDGKEFVIFNFYYIFLFYVVYYGEVKGDFLYEVIDI